jgi:hypothetical protein
MIEMQGKGRPTKGAKSAEEKERSRKNSGRRKQRTGKTEVKERR